MFQVDKSLEKPERVMLVGVMLDTDYAAGSAGGQVFYSAESRKAHFQTALDEAADLVRAAGGELVAVETSKRDRPHSALFVGTGKAEELAASVRLHDVGLVVFNHELTPTQERNLEKEFQCRVLDRVGLILAIFAKRAQSQEGKLQVELAQLSHLSGRLVRGYGHLQSQKGGIGLKGPGETQLETDRRLINQKITALKRQLKNVRQQRATGVLAENQLFATLDTTARRLFLSHEVSVILTDTVGFVRDLPHKLVSAFSATLEETALADVLLHVVDVSNPEFGRQMEDVNAVLEEIGAHEIPQLAVYNKIDLQPSEERKTGIVRDAAGKAAAVNISVAENLGLDDLRQAMIERALEG